MVYPVGKLDVQMILFSKVEDFRYVPNLKSLIVNRTPPGVSITVS